MFLFSRVGGIENIQGTHVGCRDTYLARGSKLAFAE
jgi:hypothetical protein